MLRSIFVGLVSFVFSIVFLVTLSFFTILTTFLNADFYKEASCFFHGTVTDWLGGDIYDRIPDVQKVATREQVVIAVKDIIKAEDFENMMMPFVGQFLAPDFDEDGVAFVSMDFSPFFEKVSTFPDVISKSICADTGECQSQELIKEQINKVFNGFYLETINEDVPTNLKSFTLQIKKQNVEILPGTTVSRDLFWDIFWILIAVNVLLLGIIALITFRPWHRVLKSVAKPVIGGVAMYALMFYALYRVYIYLNRT